MREKGGFRFKDPILDLPAHATLAIRGEISATEHQLIPRKRPRSGKRTPPAAGQYQDHAQSPLSVPNVLGKVLGLLIPKKREGVFLKADLARGKIT
jgi:hypothetical protein